MTAAAQKQEIVVAEPAAAVTPMILLERAVEKGVGVETLEKLVALQERYDANQARKEFDAAIAEAKAEIKPIVRNRDGHNSKKYVDFAAIAKVVDPILSRHGLSYRFTTEQSERINVTCVLSHRSGHFEKTTLSGPADTTGSKNAIQAIGSTLTYLQRYSLVQMLGIAASDDDDGQASGADPISEEQVKALRKLLKDVGMDEENAAFLAYMGVEKIENIPTRDYDKAVRAVAQKKAKG